MKLSALYSNQPELFPAIQFRDGLNVVFAEIRKPKVKTKDTHNLGKSTLGLLINFCLLNQEDKIIFPYKFKKIFQGFVFYLELKLNDNTYLTIRRSVDKHTKISFRKSIHSQNLHVDQVPIENWDHMDLPFKTARDYLDGILNLRGLGTWSYRNLMGYLLRGQNDYQQVFQLSKYKGKQSKWKPFLAYILGFDAELVQQFYRKKDEAEKLRIQQSVIEKEIGLSSDMLGNITGRIILKKGELEEKQTLLDQFDFGDLDREKIELLVEQLDEDIAAINERLYITKANLKKIRESLARKKAAFNLSATETLFGEAGILFAGQIKRDFEALTAFNQAISRERRKYLQEEEQVLIDELELLEPRLHELSRKRKETLSFLSEESVFEKYQSLSKELADLQADIAINEKKQQFLESSQNYKDRAEQAELECRHLQKDLSDNVKHESGNEDSFFSHLRRAFNNIVKSVINKSAFIGARINKEGNLEVTAEILGLKNEITGADDGHTYKKLLCMAFDLAVLKTHLGHNFPRFVFHDGALESLDDRKKENLLNILRKLNQEGIQTIITMIDSDLPYHPDRIEAVFEPEEIVVRLHDDGNEGRLFKMPEW